MSDKEILMLIGLLLWVASVEGRLYVSMKLHKLAGEIMKAHEDRLP